MKNVLYLLFLIFFVSCKPEQKVVEAKTSSILEPVTTSFNNQLGEISIGTAAIPLTLTVTNNSSNEITHLNLDIGKYLSVFNYAPDDDNISTSPGHQGTCKTSLTPQQSCTYNLLFNPRKTGKYEIPLIFSYQNLIRPETKNLILTALVGEPAALVFTNDITKYDFGVLEQTDLTEKKLDLEIQNVGGLSARDIVYPLTNDSVLPSFRILENHCLARLGPQEKCKISIAYKSLNTAYTDPETKYSAKLAIAYKKDASGKTDKLNAFFSYISSTIEAKFITNYRPIDFGQVVAGTKLTRSIKISNSGYNFGLIKSINFHRFDGSLYATCTKGISSILNCNRTLIDFPFVIEDKSNCFNKEIKGIVGKTAGESCFIDVTYWPSRTYEAGTQVLHDFNNSKLALTYDSRWLNQDNIVTVNNMFDITANFIAGGKLQLESIMIEDQYLSTGKISTIDGNTYEANLGRIAKIADPSMDTFYKITLKNTGESPTSLISLKDGAITPNEITDTGSDLNLYYKGIKHNSCGYVAPGATCSFSYLLVPLLQGSTTAEDSLMYDNTVDSLKKYKKFILTYDNGSTLEDDGTIGLKSIFELRQISKLIAKGVLSFVEPLSQSTSIVNGETITKFINLKNMGTGDIFAISHSATNNLFPKAGMWSFPYRIIPAGTPPLPATKDCYDIIYPIGQPLSSDIPSPGNFLTPGQSCALAIEIKSPNTIRLQNSDYLNKEHERLFAIGLNSTEELWSRRSLPFPNITINFKYYDGDANPDDLSSLPFGYLAKTKDMVLEGDAKQPPSISVVDPTPAISAMIARPALTYPAINQAYPIARTYAGYSVPETYFDFAETSGLITNMFYASTNTENHIKALGIVNNDVIFHIGTYKVGTINYAELKFFNSGHGSASSSTLSEEEISDSPITVTAFSGMTAKPFPPISVPPNQKVMARFRFMPTASGTFSRCYELAYNNQIGGTWTHRVCLYAEAINDAPLMKVEYQNINVAYDSGTSTITETPSGIWNTVNAPINVPLNNPLFGPDTTSKIVFDSVKGSTTYDLKLIRITNIGNATATKFNYSFLSAVNTPATLIPEITTKNADGVIPTCIANMTIAANDSCEFYLKYKPLTTSANLYSSYIGIIYDMGLGLGQNTSQMTTMQFNAIDPAKLVVFITGVSSESVTNWSNPAIPLPQSVSWPIFINNYSAANTHMITVANPTILTKTNIEIKNSSNLKASFLSMNPTPTNTWNEIVNNSNVIISANKACFYGDDEFNGAIPANEKGFNSTSINKCLLQLDFKANVTYHNCSAYNAPIKTKTVIMGGRILASCNPYVFSLNFYNYKRLSTEKIYLHMKGFIEPNRSVAASSSFIDVKSTSVSGSTGSVKFTWPSISPQNPAFGPIAKYRVFYSTNYNDLKSDNMFFGFAASPVLSYFDTSNASIDTVTISNLVQGKYYFFRVAAIRNYMHPTYGNLSYISVVQNLPILTLPIPTLAETYNHSTKTLLDKTPLPITGNRTAGITACASKKYNVNMVGSARVIPKLMINTPIWNNIINNPDISTGYPMNDVGTIPHWLSDNAYNMPINISLYDGTTLPGFPGYDSSKLTGNNSANKVIYSKACSNLSSCDQLYKVVGGDDVDLYHNGAYYTTATGISAYHRCYAVILCPSNYTKKITDVTCVQP